MRKLATAAAVSLALASGGAFGLGLGDIEMRSALNQPMNAEIRLTAVKPGEIDGMIVQLASPDAFARAGIERSSALSDLTFSVDQSSGTPVIRISSQRPVVEPFLNFLLEVDWPQGRMVREYTVLLDPPVFMTPSATERNTTADQPAIVQRGEEALVLPTPIERNTVADSVSDDEFEVELVGLDEELGDQATNALDDGGEIVSLDSLSDSALLSDSAPTLDTGGEVVSLTDLAAPNSEAIEQREAAFDLDSIQVELLGTTEEVSDAAVVDAQPVAVAQESLDAQDSSIVSLDDLLLETPVEDTTAAAPASEVTVQSGDTLYNIAQANTVPGASVQQMMMALLAANESAFINQNINLVKAGAILRVPDAEETARLTQSQALAAIGEQNQLWQEYRDNLQNSQPTRLAQNVDTATEQAIAPSSSAETGAQSEETEAPTAVSTPIETAALDAEVATDELSAEAQAILENARQEILNREELRIVADNAPASTAASATADETQNNEAQLLGEVNRKLQLAREELSSTRLQADDLTDQASELQNTTENLDALVLLRQNEVAKLEAQLADARRVEAEAAEAESAEAEAQAALAAEAEELAAQGNETAESLIATATDVADDAATAAAQTGDELIADASTAIADAGDAVAGSVSETGEEAMEAGTNALTSAGETLGQVELLPEETEQAAAEAEIPPPVKQTSWYQDFLADPKRMAIAGIGGIGLLGVLGTLLFRRRSREDDSMLDVGDDVEFYDADDADQVQADIDSSATDATGTAAGIAAGTAAAGGVIAAGAADALDNTSNDDQLSDTLAELGDSSLAFGSETQAVADATSEQGIEKDDTISEADVYLAYGLHGQAEELLTKAIERKPNQPEYAQKLLQTYHAQGNGEGFHQAAQNFHARFGGDDNPDWANIAAMGVELRPNDPLYAAAQDSVNAIGAGHSDGSQLGEEDFASSSEEEALGSISRDFGANESSSEEADETDLMDQSIDPAFAFDEGDLEATGDFSQIANELAAENDGSIDFPDFDSTLASSDDTASLDDSISDTGDLLSDALNIDKLEGVPGASDDMTLDLDQLSGDLELDTSELLSSDLDELEIPDLTSDNDLLIDDTAAISGGADNADEMDTMLDLAKAYIDMGDKDSASSALGEIVKSGNPEQITEAETLLRKIS
ncbi:MAG: FimV/HubP family polar landmark protein [Granulosicoccus sp.]